MGLLGTIYCALFMIIRYWDNSYSNTGRFYRDLAVHFRPVFDTKQVTLSEMVGVLTLFLKSSLCFATTVVELKHIYVDIDDQHIVCCPL